MKNNQQIDQDDEISLMDLLLVVAKHNRFILKSTIAVAVLATICTLLLTDIYTAKTVIVPPQSGDFTPNIAIANIVGFTNVNDTKKSNDVGSSSPGIQSLGMLKSLALAERIVQTNQLKEYYHAKSLVSARDTLIAATVITLGKDGFITIEFSDKDPKLAATIANAYVAELDYLNQEVAKAEAIKRRAFLSVYDAQISEIKEALMSAFDKSDAAGQQNGSNAFKNAQSLQAKRLASNLLAKVAEKELQISGLHALEEQGATPTQVIDKAKPTEEKSKPKRALIAMIATLMAFFLSLLIAFVREAMANAVQDPEQAKRLGLLRQYLLHGR